MSKFKVGDRVVCIDDIRSEGRLKLNEVYTICHVSGCNMIYLEGSANVNDKWFAFRFKLWTPCEDILQGILDD